ncbi:hypothetical protein OYE22_20135 [Streptomyces sp. 71268]|uniref:hypothetical protein n=1 Tax=Streptomyces sp. 71268 TaxID=3002640 RepID=UPI0023F801C7|nr:hypothetical protein [Streptomyces sp. 71268]WEV27252.1 hypothetical protein OYE22_20135 [Streptomyces sp. 71268]
MGVESSGVEVNVNGSNGQGKKGTLTPRNSNWKPPACWYEPRITPKELKGTIEGLEKMPGFFGIGPTFAQVYKTIFQTHKYDDYNMKKQGKGQFWVAVVNENRKDEPEAQSCNRLPFWVDEGDTPDEPLAISTKILAEYAYDELPVPDTDITMNPSGKQTVNLDTWIWLDKSRFKPVSATASLPSIGLSATTTAKPVSLTIEPGTQDAKVHPASGECRIAADGSIGTPYSDDRKNQAPPCGVTYLRATNQTGPHPLKATVTWEIYWTSSDGDGGALPTGTYGDTTDVTVGEVQSINR